MQTKSNNIHAPLYYETHKDKACILIADQLANEWHLIDILQYWEMLGYDTLFVRLLMNPLIVKGGGGNIWN